MQINVQDALDPALAEAPEGLLGGGRGDGTVRGRVPHPSHQSGSPSVSGLSSRLGWSF